MRALTAFIATPSAIGGNRVTALRWAKRLRELGWRVRVGAEWTDAEPCDLLVALHAHRSHASIAAHARLQPDAHRVVALTGTDVYGDLAHDSPALESLALASRIVVLQPRALARVPAQLQARTRVIRQSAVAAPAEPLPWFTACSIAHLRDVKDPLLAARAARLLPDDSIARIVHVGAAHDESWRERAHAAERDARGRWSWIGERRRSQALSLLAGAQLLVLTSRAEGGANVVTEAIAAGVPVISTRIEGSLGILGDDYPGYCAVGDADDLARAISRCEREPGFLDELRRRVVALQPLIAPERERASWRELLAEMELSHGGH